MSEDPSGPQKAAEESPNHWLLTYICVRLAEHYPELWSVLSPEAVVLILELTLDGLSRLPEELPHTITSSLSFDEGEEEEDGSDESLF